MFPQFSQSLKEIGYFGYPKKGYSDKSDTQKKKSAVSAPPKKKAHRRLTRALILILVRILQKVAYACSAQPYALHSRLEHRRERECFRTKDRRYKPA